MRKMKRDFEVTFKGITSRGGRGGCPDTLLSVPYLNVVFRYEALRVEPLRGDFRVSHQTH